MKRRTQIWIIALLLLQASCGLKRGAVSLVGGIAWDGQAVLEREADVDLARQTTPSLIATLSAIAYSKPGDRTFSALLAKAYGQYAYGFYEEDLLRFPPKGDDYVASFARADHFYRQGMTYGMEGLRHRHVFRQSETAPQPDFEKALRSFRAKDAPLLFWTAFCWGGLINLHRDDPLLIAQMPRVIALVDRVMELTPDAFEGSVHNFRAVLDASRPTMLGGNPARAKAEFDKAIAIEPRYHMTKVLYAQYYAVQMQDRHLFEKLLQEVQSADATTFAEQRLANELAKRRATFLFAKEQQWF